MNTLTKLSVVLLLLVIGSFCGGLVSCQGGKKMSDEATKLDSLTTLLDLSVKKLEAIDSATVELKYNTTMADINYVEHNLKDSISRQEAEAVSSYRATRKNLKSFNQKRRMLLAEYAITEKQLKTLSVDLKKGAIDDNKAYEYFVIECTEANKLLLSMTDLLERINGSLSTNSLYKPQVDSLMARIELKVDSSKNK